jgi:hypothetical protein
MEIENGLIYAKKLKDRARETCDRTVHKKPFSAIPSEVVVCQLRIEKVNATLPSQQRCRDSPERIKGTIWRRWLNVVREQKQSHSTSWICFEWAGPNLQFHDSHNSVCAGRMSVTSQEKWTRESKRRNVIQFEKSIQSLKKMEGINFLLKAMPVNCSTVNR